MSKSGRVKAILEAHGVDVTIKHKSSTTRNYSTGAVSATNTDYTAKAHLRLYHPREIAGLVAEGDREMRLSVDAISIVPKKNDTVVVNGQQFNIVSIDTRTIEGENALYIIQLRGG